MTLLTGGGGAAGNPAYRPLPCDAPMETMAGVKMSTSLYDETVKSCVHMLCHLLGARYSDRLGRKAGTDGYAHHVRGCHITQETRVPNAFDDVAGHLSWSLPRHLMPYISRNEDSCMHLMTWRPIFPCPYHVT